MVKSWVRFPNITLMRGCRRHPSVDKFRTDGEEKVRAHTWEAPAPTAAKRERPLRISSVRVENLRGGRNVKITGGYVKGDWDGPKKSKE